MHLPPVSLPHSGAPLIVSGTARGLHADADVNCPADRQRFRAFLEKYGRAPMISSAKNQPGQIVTIQQHYRMPTADSVKTVGIAWSGGGQADVYSCRSLTLKDTGFVFETGYSAEQSSPVDIRTLPPLIQNLLKKPSIKRSAQTASFVPPPLRWENAMGPADPSDEAADEAPDEAARDMPHPPPPPAPTARPDDLQAQAAGALQAIMAGFNVPGF